MNKNGCWYYQKEDENLLFSWEFDTYVHLDCAKKYYEKDNEDIEARIIYNELSKYNF